MHAFRRARRLRSPVVLLLVALSFAVWGPPVTRASAAGGRTAHVTPASNLGDQVALVVWQGFRPTRPDGTYGVTILECRLHPKSVANDCNTAETFPFSLTGNQAAGVTQANGTGDAFIDVQSTARLPALGCSHTNPCSLLLYENTPAGFDPAGLPPARALVRLDFRENSADCPPPTSFDVRLETEASAAAAFYQWAADLCSTTKPFALDVTNTSSNAARQQFFLKHVDVAVSSMPPGTGEVTRATPAYAVAPVDLTALVVAYNIVDPVNGRQITDVTLTPRLIARLVSDTDVLGFFQDPEFKKLNPGHTFPAAAADPGVRAEQNADTRIVTNWLNADSSARRFLDGKDPYGIPVNDAWKGVKYPTDLFEARNPNGVYLPRTGEEDIALRLFHSTKPADGVPTNPADVGFFSILDLPTARRFNLPIAKLTTGFGKPGRDGELGQHRRGLPGDDDHWRGIPCRGRNAWRPRGVAVDEGRSRARPDRDGRERSGEACEHPAAAPLRGRARTRHLARRLHPAARRAHRTDGANSPRVVGSDEHHYDHHGDDHDDDRGRAAYVRPGNGQHPVQPFVVGTNQSDRFRRRDTGRAVAERRRAYRQCGSRRARSPRDSRAQAHVGGRRAIRAADPLAPGHAGARVCRVRSGPPPRSVVRHLRVANAWATTTSCRGGFVNSRASSAVLDGTNAEVDERLAVVGEPAATPKPRVSRPIPLWALARRSALTLGVVVVVFVAFAMWFSGLAHARSQVGLQRRFRAELAAANAPIGGVIAPGAPVAILDISRIGVHEVVVEGTRSGQLREGPGHLVGSSLPGQPGNAVIAGRRTTYGGPFRHLTALRPGDDIHLTTGDGSATYRITGTASVRAEDGSVFADHGDNRLTLFTADPPFDPSRRLVVTARLTGNAFAAQPLRRALDPEGLGLTGDRGAIASVLVWLELLVALSVLAVFAVTRWSRLATWIVFAPGIAVVAWLLFENAVRLLPATL